jgi:hypothetical protein
MRFRLRVLAAKYVLDRVTSQELVNAADGLLSQEVYSISLAELAGTRYPILSEVGPLFVRALRDLAVPLPSPEEAAELLVKHDLWQFTEGAIPTEEALHRFAKERYDWRDRGATLLRSAAGSCGFEYASGWLSEMSYLESLRDDGYVSQQEWEHRQGEIEAQVGEAIAHWAGDYRRTHLAPSWLTWNGGVVRHLARAVADQRAFDRLPLLADALEEAGCDNPDILDHCREVGPHPRNCWVVDLLLAEA